MRKRQSKTIPNMQETIIHIQHVKRHNYLLSMTTMYQDDKIVSINVETNKIKK